MKDQDLSECPVCGAPPIFALWLEDNGMFAVECPDCTTFTITKSLAALLRCSVAQGDREALARLSGYLRSAGDDGERELTEESWMRLAGQKQSDGRGLYDPSEFARLPP